MIRVTFDANILVAGMPAETGTLADLMDRWRANCFQLVISRHIITEVRRSWSKPYWRRRLSPTLIDHAIDVLNRDADVIPIAIQVTGVAAHAADDLVLATAISGSADYLVTGDLLFRSVESHQGIIILTPREFLDLLDRDEN